MMVNEEKETEQASENIDERDKRETLEALDRADQVAERMARENTRRERLIEREEALEARRKLGGQTDSGVPEKKKEEMSDEEYAKRALDNTLL